MVSIWTAVLSGVFALLGIIAGGVFQFLLAERTNTRLRSERRDDARTAEDAAERKLRSDRALPALKIARHLERYARLCADTVSRNSVGSGYSDYAGFPIWKSWPKAISWELLGATTSAKAQDFETRVSLHELWLSGNIEFGASDATDAATYAAETAARAGFEAWEIAKSVRVEAGLPAFTFVEHVWNYPETLSEAVEKERQKERERAARRAAQDDDGL